VRRRWAEGAIVGAVGLLLVAVGAVGAGAVRGRPAASQAARAKAQTEVRLPRPGAGSGAACWSDCATDSECEAAEAAASEAIEDVRREARAYAEFQAKCAQGKVPCFWRR